jgi:hypothetical protein
MTRGACVTYGEKRYARRVLMGSVKERYHLEDLGVDDRIILKWVVSNTEALYGLLWLRIGTSGGCF